MIGFFSLYENSSELKRCWWVFARKKLLCWMSVLTLALTKPQSVLLALVFLLEYGKYTTSLCSLHLYKFVSTFRQPVTWATNRSSILCPIWWKYECLNMPHRSRLCWRRCLCFLCWKHKLDCLWIWPQLSWGRFKAALVCVFDYQLIRWLCNLQGLSCRDKTTELSAHAVIPAGS